MSAKILDGKIVRDKLAEKLKTLNSKLETKSKLVIIQVGNLEESNAYIRQKVLFSEKIGATVQHDKFKDDILQRELITHISSLNTDRQVNGIIIQLPIPLHLDKDALIDSISPTKDVDGQTATNVKKLIEGSSFRHPRESEDQILDPASTRRRRGEQVENDRRVSLGFIPATTKGILTLLDYYKINVKGKKAVVVGRSSLVGKPTALALLNLGATVTICHSQTKDLAKETKLANILVVAVGKPNLMTKEHVSKNQVVIDVGITVTENQAKGQAFAKGSPKLRPGLRSASNLVGDVKFDEVARIVDAISPVPGGVGPLTVASLFENLLAARKHQN